MKKCILLICSIQIIALLSCENKENVNKLNSAIKDYTSYDMIYELKNDSLQIIARINQVDLLHIAFSLDVTKEEKTEKVKGTAELILLEDENGNKYIPEGTAIEDRNQKEDNSYFCDSTYSFASNEISLGFGFEEDAKRRLCLTGRYDNRDEFLTGTYYTLYRKK